METYILIEKKASAERVKQWYSKLAVYEVWHPHYLAIEDKITVWDLPDSEAKTMTIEEYNAGVGTRQISPPIWRVLEKTDNLKDSYLWKKIAKGNKDELDKQFEVDRSSFIRIPLYGLHTYGGYYAFFRPDLEEVINLIDQSNDSRLKLENVERVYVTTEAHPSDNIRYCYDSKADRHRGETVCYVVPLRSTNENNKP